MAIARKIAYNVAVSSVAKVFSTILALVSIGFITRYLGKEGFGDYATVLAFLSFFASVADLGLYSISTREISREGADEEKIIGNIFSLRVISALIVLIASPVVVLFFDYPLAVKEGIVIAAASFVFSSGYQVLNGLFQQNLAMDRVAVGELVGKIVQVAGVIIAVKLNLGFNWIIGSLLFNMIASFLIVFFWSKKYIRFHMRFDFGYWKIFLKESLPLGVGSMIVFVYFKMDTILLSIMKTNADVGIYSAAYKVLENLTFFPAMIAGLILPIMANTIFRDKKRFQEISNKTFKFFVLIIVPLVIGTLFLANGVINLIGGGQFADSSNVLRILVFAIAAIFFSMFFNNILIAGNQQKKLIYIWSLAAATNVTLNLIFIPKFSYLAAASISVLTELLVAGAAFAVVVKKIKYYPRVEKKFGIMMAGGGMVVFLIAFQSENFFMLALGSAAVYFFGLWLFKAVKTSEITSLFTKQGVEEFEHENLP
ncbi:MAG: flippase [Parcubacteria group bacterium]|jgi:O-antigen/teichoic acid export membrane protein